MNAQFVIDQFQSQQGWTDDTVLDLLVQYIDNQGSGEALYDMLLQIAEEENAS